MRRRALGDTAAADDDHGRGGQTAHYEGGDPQAFRTQPTGQHDLQTLPGPIRDRGFIPVRTPTGARGAGLEKDGGTGTPGAQSDREGEERGNIRADHIEHVYRLTRTRIPPNKERKLTTEFARQDLAQNSSSAAEPDRVRVIRDGVASYLPDIDTEETGEWLESFDELLERSGPARARYLMLRLAGTRWRTTGGHPCADVDGLRQHHPHRTGAVVSRRRGRRTSLPRLDPVERRDHGASRAAPGSRCGGPYFDVCVLGRALRGRFQPLLPRQVAPRRRRSGLHPGPRLAGHLRPRVPRGPANRAISSTASARSTATPAADCRRIRTRV